VSLVGACAKLRKETNWAGLAFCWLAGCWRGVALERTFGDEAD
jgi:hypothetical protein